MKKNIITLAITLAAAGSIFMAVGYNGLQIAHAGDESNKNAPVVTPTVEHIAPNKAQILPAQRVAIQVTQAANYHAQVEGYGETKAHYELDFTSEVSGRVMSLHSAFAEGNIIQQGDVIAELDNTTYQQAVTQAQADVATARLAYLEEQREGEQAKSEWQRSGLSGEPSSPLVLREPQLANAKANLSNAQQTLIKAEKDLADTKLRAPFDALVVSRSVQPGSYLQAGGAIATLYSIDQVEIAIPLSDQQWSNLPQWNDSSDWQVALTNSAGDQNWIGQVDRTYQHVTQSSRQRSLVVVVEKPLEQAAPLYPGTFVQASLQGKELENLWEIPASALSQQGEVWTVDSNNELQKSSATVQFKNNGSLFIRPTAENDKVQVVKRPLSTFLAGMKATPVEED
ncbi:efflux transporter periplasmic adaptor subunit [Vibrio sp. 10N.286.49.B3]|uniref:efflux RND transporter periplasmic adaptor subunit n=1 Tax=Vibrio sp. 10N.286.49.B3 TaxID=1880855 RepID=UPI000C821978|nr:efflux RND transporter periplasmic adaptor subunit [Vibrio sp. 10N.286.49.B3]PMH43252.1 efflux transporter periplasmic adaptor subunit [Vibrio sp. 10N.286.49.B3]